MDVTRIRVKRGRKVRPERVTTTHESTSSWLTFNSERVALKAPLKYQPYNPPINTPKPIASQSTLARKGRRLIRARTTVLNPPKRKSERCFRNDQDFLFLK